MNKQEAQEIIFKAIQDAKNKTIEQLQELINTNSSSLYISIIKEIIDTRQQELNYSDGTGAIYL